MRYAVTLRGPRSTEHPHGSSETVIVEAESGDEATDKAFKPHHIISGVEPAPKKKAA